MISGKENIFVNILHKFHEIMKLERLQVLARSISFNFSFLMNLALNKFNLIQ